MEIVLLIVAPLKVILLKVTYREKSRTVIVFFEHWHKYIWKQELFSPFVKLFFENVSF